MSVWDDPSLSTGDYIKFENVGDSVVGDILDVSLHQWDDGSKSPKLVLDCNGEEKILTAGQVRLKAALAEERPEVGDKISIKFTELEKRSGGKTLKHFEVAVKKGGATAKPKAAEADPFADADKSDQPF